MLIYICDDNEKDILVYKNWIVALCTQKMIPLELFEIKSTAELFFGVEDREPDLIYVDIDRRQTDGIEMLKHLRLTGYRGDFIICTNNKARALDGYEVGALRYFIKSELNETRFKDALTTAVQNAQRRNRDVIMLSCAGETRAIPLWDIVYFEVQRRIATVHYGQHIFSFYASLGKLEEKLLQKGFIRIHASYLIPIAAVRKVCAKNAELLDGTCLPVSRTYQKNLKVFTNL